MFEQKIINKYCIDYKCPNCGSIIKCRLSVTRENLLIAGCMITCTNCGKTSRPAENINNVKKIFRFLHDYSPSDEEIKKHNVKVYLDAVTACAAIIINADNIVKSEEVRTYKEFCKQYFNEYLEFAHIRLKFYLDNIPKTHKVIKKLKTSTEALKELLLILLCDIASSDGEFAECEEKAIDIIVSELELPQSLWQAQKIRIADIGEEYKILGISTNASFEEVKRAYLEKCKEFHPDRYQNLPTSFQEFANSNFKKVQQAYEKLKVKYGK